MRIPAIALLLACFCTPALAQGPRVEVFGGYSYLNIDPGTNLISRQSANGWEASASGELNRWFGLEGSVAGYYKTYPIGSGFPDVTVHDYSYGFGPRFNYRPVFVHALFGGDHLTGTQAGSSASQDSIALALGGGIEWKIAPRSRWAVRGSGDYVLTRHNILFVTSKTQNNFRASVGIAYEFGGRREAAPKEERPQASPQCAGSQASVIGATGCSSDAGFTVTAVQPGSPASSAGIVPGDVITAVNGRAIRTGQEIDAAIAASSTVKISYMIQGKWLTEREAKVR